MKFSPDDIINQTFESRFRGYDTEQVQEFLNSIAREFEHVADDNRRLRRENEAQARELKDFRRRERSLHDALDMAKQVAEEVRHQAERDAELIVAEAELKAERILAGAENRVGGVREEMMQLQQQRIRFEAELRSLLDSHGKMLDLFGEEESHHYEIVEALEDTAEEPCEGDVDDASGTEELRHTPTETGIHHN